MKKYLIALFYSVCAVNVASAESIDAPVHKPGETWTFQQTNLWDSKVMLEFTMKTLGVSGDYVRYARTTKSVSPSTGEFLPPQSMEFTQRADYSSVVTLGTEKFVNQPYKWPLEVGEKWEYSTKRQLPAPTPTAAPIVVDSKTIAEVVGKEKVSTPAGTFATFKIVYKSSVGLDTGAASAATSVNTGWYSPDVHTNVKYTVEVFGADGAPQARTMLQLMHYEPQ
jgi:hypothetical protein